MNFKKHLQSIIFFLILFSNACEEGTWELLEVDYEPVLNVFGIISLDPEVDSFVRVYRTTNLSEESEIYVGIDTITWDDEDYFIDIYEPAAIIKDAQVSIKGSGNSFSFNFVPKQYPWEYKKNVYLDTLGTFIPQPGTTYLLEVTAPGYDTVKGELITPQIPVLIDSLIQDTISTKREYRILWKQLNEGKGYLTGRLDDQKVNYDKGCEPDFDRVVDLQSGSYIVPVKLCDDQQSIFDETQHFIIQLMTMDENYYNYFIRGEEGGYSNFLLNSGTTSGQSVGIEGGLGIFGSIATSKLYLILDD